MPMAVSKLKIKAKWVCLNIMTGLNACTIYELMFRPAPHNRVRYDPITRASLKPAIGKSAIRLFLHDCPTCLPSAASSASYAWRPRVTSCCQASRRAVAY
jgi:hypothetical protein